VVLWILPLSLLYCYAAMNDIDLFGNPINKVNSPVIVNNGEYVYFPNFFTKLESDRLFRNLRGSVNWKQESMLMYGRKVDFPRLTAWYGDNDKPYSFSGITLNPENWTEDLMLIKNKIEPQCRASFNSVLLNLYRDGNDSISWHTDAERELGVNPVIASVNFGETRKFQLRHLKTKEKLEIDLAHGSLLIMRGELQHFWQHQVPKTNRKIKERINLTFRIIK
jgi:alkylated DNA repair dioxygenase AlkB